MAFGANYKAAYCLSACPAGEDVIGPFQTDRKGFLNEVVKPLQEKEETIYVVPGSDAEEFVKRRFPHKHAKQVRGSLLPRSIAGFLNGMRYTFQRGQSAGLNAVYHFTFTGKEPRTATVTIRDKKIEIIDGHAGKARSAGECRQRDLAWILGQRAQSGLGPTAPQNPHQRIAATLGCVRQMLSVLSVLFAVAHLPAKSFRFERHSSSK